MGHRTRVALATLLVATVLSLAVVPGTAAAKSEFGGTVTVDEGETVQGLQAVAGTVVVRGTVDGDLEGVAGTVVVTGTVTGDVDVSAGAVRISGTVGGDVTTATGSFSLERNASVGGHLRVAGGSVAIDGSVAGAVESAAEETTVGPSATVGGDLRYKGDLDLADGATVGGVVLEDDSLSVSAGAFGFSLPSIPEWTVALYGALVNFVVGALLLAFAPRFSAAVVERAGDQPLRAVGVGLLALVGIPVALVALLLTIVGIPISVVGFMLYGLLVWLGYVFGGYLSGTWLTSLADVESRYGALAVGLLAVAALSLVPWVGDLLGFVVFLLGFGALSWALYRRVRGRWRGDGATA